MSGHIDKIERFLFYFLFFAIPFQTRKILYSPGWYFNEWQSVSVHATDILLLALFAFWLAHYRPNLSYYVSLLRHSYAKALECKQGFGGQASIKYYGTNLKLLIRNAKSLIQKPDFFLVLFLAAALISVKNSSDFYVGFFQWLKLAEFALLYFYLKTYALRKFGFIKILYALILGGVFQAVVGIGQFLKQGDLGLRLLGESVLGPNMTGIASFFVASGEKVIRAYGTMPHPNVLAAYLFLALVAFYFVVFYSRPNKFLIHISHFIMLLGLFTSFSRTIIFLFFFNFFARGFLVNFIGRFKEKYLQREFYKEKVLPIFLMTTLAVVIFSAFYWPEVSSRMTISLEEEAVQLRVFYNKESLGGGINLFGIGLGDFTGWLMEHNPNLPRYVYQPVHNIYLLVYSEIGVLGFIFLLLFLAGLVFKFIRDTGLRELWHYSFLLVTVSILFMGLFDHFLLTIQQGRFVFWLALTLLAISDIIEEQSGKGAFYGEEEQGPS